MDADCLYYFGNCPVCERSISLNEISDFIILQLLEIQQLHLCSWIDLFYKLSKYKRLSERLSYFITPNVLVETTSTEKVLMILQKISDIRENNSDGAIAQ